jgi:hypothetical protein
MMVKPWHFMHRAHHTSFWEQYQRVPGDLSGIPPVTPLGPVLAFLQYHAEGGRFSLALTGTLVGDVPDATVNHFHPPQLPMPTVETPEPLEPVQGR